MAKRGAEKQLTDQNWEEEEESEEPGVFTQAKEDVLKTRQIRKAKRRGVSGESTTGAAFKGFAGFGAPSAAAPTFTFGASNKPLGGLAASPNKPLGAASLNPGSPAQPAFSFGLAKSQSNGPESSSATPAFGAQKPAAESKPVSNGTKDGDKSKYLAQLKNLNKSVARWILEHVEKNACCILTPIFKDYEKHLAEIEKLNPDAGGSKDTVSTPPVAEKSDLKSSTVAASGGFDVTEKPAPSVPATTAPSGGPVFSFSSSTSGSAGIFGGKSSTSGFSFGSSESKPASSLVGGFKFGATQPAESKPAADAEEEEYVPPKADVTEVQEDDAFYTKRCKLFYQKNGAWVERGVGNLHLKPCGEKTQLVMRADTSLGNILLNIMLAPSMPMKRQGKNNVSIICVPNPPLDPKADDKKPASMLIRVKTAEDADELLENMEKHKGEQ